MDKKEIIFIIFINFVENVFKKLKIFLFIFLVIFLIIENIFYKKGWG